MDKKLLVPVLTVVIIAVLGLGFVLTKGDKTDTKETAGTNGAKQFSPPKACDVFVVEDAKKAIGDAAEKPEGADAPGASSEDIEVSQCLYQTPANDLASIKTQKQANLLVRGAKSESGSKSNEEVFTGSLKPAGAQDVAGYGEAAFWNPEFAQLNILKTGNWYILQVGSSVPTERTLEEAKKLADVLEAKL